MLKVKSMNLSQQGLKKVEIRIQKACRSLWLSTNRAIEEVYEHFEALTLVLNSATGLLKQIGNIKFLSAVYLHDEIERVWKAAEALYLEVGFLE